jgi:hypothetical protein
MTDHKRLTVTLTLPIDPTHLFRADREDVQRGGVA